METEILKLANISQSINNSNIEVNIIKLKDEKIKIINKILSLFNNIYYITTEKRFNDSYDPNWNNTVNQQLLKNINSRIDKIHFNDGRYNSEIKNNLKSMIQRNKEIKSLDDIFSNLNKKTLIVDFENLNFGIDLQDPENIEIYSESQEIKNILKNNLIFIFNMIIEERFEKLFIVCKKSINNILNSLFINNGFEYITPLNLSSIDFLHKNNHNVFYYMKDTLDKVKNQIKNNTLTVDIINVFSKIPHNNYVSEPNLKKLNSFDDCTIVYLANKLQSNKCEYKIISSDLKMFNDFNFEERQILLPYFILKLSLLYRSEYDNYTNYNHKVELQTNEFLVDPINDSFFKIVVPINKIEPNEICMLRKHENDHNPCNSNPSKNLHLKIKEHYFKPKSGMNHIIKDHFIPNSIRPPKYRAFFNIKLGDLLENFEVIGFKSKEDFYNSLYKPYYY